jgi:hypothetical protein
MAYALLFEIWENSEDNSFEMSSVTAHGDGLRTKIAPKSVLRHSFRAKSNFEAFQMNHDWHGSGRWTPEPGWPEQPFTAEQVAIQDRYLLIRNGS